MESLKTYTDRFNEWEDKDVLSEAVVNTMTIDGKIVGIPYEMTVRAYLTHADDLAATGVETPETWEDLLAQTDYYDNNGKYLTEIAATGVRSAQELIVYLAQYDLRSQRHRMTESTEIHGMKIRMSLRRQQRYSRCTKILLTMES